MNTTFALGNGLKVIDLTKPLDPKTESTLSDITQADQFLISTQQWILQAT